jgi:hypothetical protein
MTESSLSSWKKCCNSALHTLSKCKPAQSLLAAQHDVVVPASATTTKNWWHPQAHCINKLLTACSQPGASMAKAKPREPQLTRFQRMQIEQPWCVYCGGIASGTSADHGPPRIAFDFKRRPKGLEFNAATTALMAAGVSIKSPRCLPAFTRSRPATSNIGARSRNCFAASPTTSLQS